MATPTPIYVRIAWSGNPTDMDLVGCDGMFIESVDIVKRPDPFPLTLQSRISAWATETFGEEAHGQRIAGVYNHLVREIEELGDKLYTMGAAEEIADCAILLFELAQFRSVDLLTEVEGKFAINQTREWGNTEEDGAIQHIKEKSND